MVRDQYAVLVQNVCKSYGSKVVLNNFNMTVERGSIYGLLGASGCGKTTLLSAIVGRKSINSGEIWVLGGKPGSVDSGVPGPGVGYMPQDIALVGEFTVREAVFYFGRILGMKHEQLKDRFEKLSKLLDLPPQERYLKNCSGGQQRRCSFAAALVHMPELLILDEPTVGVDPVLRDRIWDYLVEITQKEQIAVIITTHYIEEARQANKIGLMREGRLLAQESPTKLLSLFQKDTLEEVFLILSRRQEAGTVQEEVDINNLPDQQNNVLQFSGSQSSIATFEVAHGSTDVLTKKPERRRSKHVSAWQVNSNSMRALFEKNIKQFCRNTAGIIFLLMFPIMQSTIFLTAIGGDIKDIPMAIVNHETNLPSCPDFNMSSSAFKINDTCMFHEMSCRFLHHLDISMIKKKSYTDVDEAIEAIRHGTVTGVVYITENFTESIQNRLNDGADASDYDLDSSEIKIWMDMSNRQIGATLKSKILRIYIDFQKSVFSDCEFIPKLADIPINFNDFIYGNDDQAYTVFLMPGVIITLIFFLGAMMTSQIIISDRCEGVWDRSIVAGVTSLEITLTHFSLQAVIVLVQTIELFIVTFAIFNMECEGSLYVLFLIVYLQGVCGMSYGFWVSVICSNYTAANVVTTGSFMPMILICGMVWPLEAMPNFLIFLSRCTPFTIAIESFRNVSAKKYPLSDLQVWNCLPICIGWTLFFIGVSLFMIKNKR